MYGKIGSCLFALAAISFGAACNKPLTTTQLQEERMQESRERPRPHMDDMADNAMARDMSVADFHFVGHTAELSGTGTVRLDRMAQFLDTYGGMVRYETVQTDEGLINQRLEHVREYLALTGCDMERVEIKAMMSGGRGTPAVKAIESEEKAAAQQSTPQQSLGLGIAPS